MDHLYFVVALLSLSAIGTAGFMLCRAPISIDEIGNNCRISRNYLVFAYFLIVATHLAELFFGICSDITGIRFALTLIITSFQGFLFYSALMALLQGFPVARKEFWGQAGLIAFFSVLLLLSRFLSIVEFELISFVSLAAYGFQLSYYSYRFIRKDKEFLCKLNNYFSGDEAYQMKWLRRSFLGMLCIGFASFLVLLCSPYLYFAYTCFYTLFYIYFAVKIFKYFTIFGKYAVAISLAENEKAIVAPLCGTEAFIPALEKWILAKGFVKPDISLRALAADLNTNQTYLSNYINTFTGQSFRNWISRLRIEEAEILLNAHPDYAVSYVGELVGILNKSSFFRQFANVTGMTPNEFRKKSCQNDSVVSKRGKKEILSETNRGGAVISDKTIETGKSQPKNNNISLVNSLINKKDMNK